MLPVRLPITIADNASTDATWLLAKRLAERLPDVRAVHVVQKGRGRARAAFALWGGWLVVTAAVFSFMQGIFHAYYAVALAPAVGALVGMGVTGLWEVRHHPLTRWWLAGTMATTAVWSWLLLRRTPDWHPELARWCCSAGWPWPP